MFEDKQLVCQDCGDAFVFTVDQQQFYADKGWDKDPRRCKPCADKRKAERNAEGGGAPRGNFGGAREDRQMYPITCDDCGQPGEVPFQPTQGKPVYCRNCKTARMNAEGGGNTFSGGARGPREERQMFKITCDSCGQPGEVPFQPMQGKPVLCRNCFAQKRAA